jgi:hypothetical protein
VHSMSVRLTCHARSMVSEYSALSRGASQEMNQVSLTGLGLGVAEGSGDAFWKSGSELWGA